MKKSLVLMLLAFASAATIQQAVGQAAQSAPAGQAAPSGQGAAQKPEIKNPAEYNAYINAIQQQNPVQKAQSLEAFLQTYPNSVMKTDALELLMVSYQQAGDSQSLHAKNFDDDALTALSVEFRVKDALPGAQIELAVGYWQSGFVVQQQRF